MNDKSQWHIYGRDTGPIPVIRKETTDTYTVFSIIFNALQPTCILEHFNPPMPSYTKLLGIHYGKCYPMQEVQPRWEGCAVFLHVGAHSFTRQW